MKIPEQEFPTKPGETRLNQVSFSVAYYLAKIRNTSRKAFGLTKTGASMKPSSVPLNGKSIRKSE